MSNLNEQNNNNFLPNFCSAEALFVVVLSSELLAIILTLGSPLYTESILFNLAMNSLFIQWIALTSVGILCLFKRFITCLSEKKAAMASYILILFVSFIITELAWWSLYVYPDRFSPNQAQHGLFLLRSLGISAIVAAVVLRYLYVQHQWRKNIEAAAMSRFQALQSRIRPHFLFNCMNTIASLTRKAPELAEQSVEDLSDLFRASLLEPTELYKIAEEWKLCKHYLRIEKHRLAERLNVEWEIASIPDDALVPPLSLQPLLENSIYHGIERLPKGGTINIKGEMIDNNILKITFNNPTAPLGVEDTHVGNKLAQENIRQRLITLFGKSSDLIIETENEQYSVTLSLPYKRYEDTDR